MGVQGAPANGGGPLCEASADVVAALGALVDCCSQVESEPLKRDVSSATQQLLGHVEGCCQKVVQEIVAALKQPGSASLAYDKVWALRHVGKQSEMTRRWMLEADTTAAIAEVMAAHPDHNELLEEGSWLAYVLGGVDGFVELLRLGKAMPCGTKGTMAVQQAAAWTVYQLASRQVELGRVGPSEWPQANELVLLLLEAMRSHPVPNADLLWGCCKALRALMEEQPIRGSLFIDRGGGEALLGALDTGQALGAAGEEVLAAGMRLVTALVEGNSSVAQRLRSMGALDRLVMCGLSLPGRSLDETMWTLGQVGGPLAVLRVMNRPAGTGGDALSGLRTLAKITWEPVDESLQQQFPLVVQELLQLTRLVAADRPEELVFTVQALGGALKVCAPHADPGTAAPMDDGISLLLDALRAGRQEPVVMAACVSMGAIAECAPAWRSPLQAALPDLVVRLRQAGDSKENCDSLRDLLWASGCIGGLPVILEEMRQQPNASGVQFAGICAIVDVLEHDEGAPSAGDCQGPVEAIAWMTVSLRLHRAVQTLQISGCRAVALLCQGLPPEADVPEEALDAVLAALRRHPNEFKVVDSVFSALRSFLEPRPAAQDPLGAVARTATKLRGIEASVPAVRRVLRDFSAGGSGNTCILENCLFVLSLLEGVPTLLEAMTDKDGSMGSRSAGLQVLCDLARGFRHLLAPHSKDVVLVAGAMVRDAVAEGSALRVDNPGGRSRKGREGEMDGEVAELSRRAQVLEGLLSGL